MVDANPVDAPVAQQLECKRMGPFEHLGIFHAERGQLVDVEEPAVVDLLGGDSPVRQSIGLRGEQRVQAVEAPRIVFHAIERGHRALNVREDGRRGRRQPREAALDDFFFAIAFGPKLRCLRIASRKMPDCRQNAEELEAGIALADLRESSVSESTPRIRSYVPGAIGSTVLK